MGVRGLATFISNNSSQYLQSHRLHNCTIIVDGNNLASQLYIYSSKSNPAYGGDYDRYYRCIKHFFDCLAECKIQALVIFDGGYEKRKLPTVWERLKGKIYACNKVNPNNQTRKNVFPLLMRETFRCRASIKKKKWKFLQFYLILQRDSNRARSFLCSVRF